MVQYISSLAKYFICIFMALYTLECFLVYRYKDENERKTLYNRQVILILLFQFACFLPICLKTENIKFIFFYLGIQVFFLIILEILPVIFPKMNRLLLNNTCMLLGIGYVIISRLDYAEALKQFSISIFAFVMGIFLLFIKRKVNSLSIKPSYYAITGFVLLLCVYIFGAVTNGSKLSVSVFGISFQASEIVKLLFVFYVAGSLYRDKSLKNVFVTMCVAAAHVLLLVFSTDLGAALIFFVVYFLMLFIATRKLQYLMLGGIGGSICAYAGYMLFRHVRVRVLAFLDPFSVIDNEGYQITQSMFAISGGGLFGRGLNHGVPSSIPYVETDFIFSAIAEEMGLVFVVFLIILCLSTFLLFINISLQYKDIYYKVSSAGLGIVYIFQVFLTVGGGTGFIPLTGVTLPLVSYGGSSVFATIITICIIEGRYTSDLRFNEPVESRIARAKDKREVQVITNIANFFCALFMVLTLYICVFMTVNREKFFNNPYNPIQRLESSANLRGMILSKDKEIMAKSVSVADEVTRIYPYEAVSAHLIGYDVNSKNGIEGYANYYLANSNAPLSTKVLAALNDELIPADNVVTTIDMKLQCAIYEAIGSFRGSIIVTAPDTGEILACLSKPDFIYENVLNEFELLDNKEDNVLCNKGFTSLYQVNELQKKLDKKAVSNLNNLSDKISNICFLTAKSSVEDNNVFLTPFSLNLISQVVYNNGSLKKPLLVKEVLNSNMNRVKRFNASLNKKVLNKDMVNALKEVFADNKSDVYFSEYKDLPYEIRFITGVGSDMDYTYFSGYSTDEAAICVTIFLENCSDNTFYVKKMAKKIFDTYYSR